MKNIRANKTFLNNGDGNLNCIFDLFVPDPIVLYKTIRYV